MKPEKPKKRVSADEILGAIGEAKNSIVQAERQAMAHTSPLNRGIHMIGFNRGFDAAVALFMSPDPEPEDRITKEIERAEPDTK